MVGFWATQADTGPSVSWVDNFNDADLAEYAHGSPGAFSLVTTPVAEGSHALRYDGNNTWNYIASDVGSGLPYYPKPGDTFQYQTRLTTNAGAESFLGFGIQSSASTWPPNAYGVRIDTGAGDSFDFEVSTGSGFADVNSVSVGFNANTWYTIEVVWGADNTFDIFAYNPDGTTHASMTGISETTHTNQGGVAYEANTRTTSGDYIYWDDFRITSR